MLDQDWSALDHRLIILIKRLVGLHLLIVFTSIFLTIFMIIWSTLSENIIDQSRNVITHEISFDFSHYHREIFQRVQYNTQCCRIVLEFRTWSINGRWGWTGINNVPFIAMEINPHNERSSNHGLINPHWSPLPINQSSPV